MTTGSIWAATLGLVLSGLATGMGGDLPVHQLIQQAGNSHDEGQRLRLLRQLAARPDLEPGLRAELTNLLPTVEDWADGKNRVPTNDSRAAENGYWCWFINSRVRPAAEGPVFPPEPAAESPLHPLWALYRGRMLLWRVSQSDPLLVLFHGMLRHPAA